jgi:predicted Zn-dependent peptidase
MSRQLTTHYIELPKKTADITVELCFPAGYFYAEPGKQEAPHLLEHYLYGLMTEAGLDCGGTTDVKFLSLYAVFSKKNFRADLLRFLEIAFLGPFNNKLLFQKQQKILLNELSGILHDPLILAYRTALNARTANKPPFTVNVEEYRAITLEDLSHFHTTYCSPEQAKLFVGAYKANDDFRDDLESALAEFSLLPPLPVKEIPKKPPFVLSGFSIVKKNLQTGRVHINANWPAPASFSDPKEQLAALLILDILCGQSDGLVWKVLQDQEGLIYDLDDRLDSYPTSGYLSINLALMKEDLVKGVSLLLSQIERIKLQDYDDSLFVKTKKKGIKASREQWFRNTGRFYWVLTDVLERKSSYSLEEWLSFYEEIDKEYLAHIAKKYLLHEDLNMVVIGDGVEGMNLAALEEIPDSFAIEKQL